MVQDKQKEKKEGEMRETNTAESREARLYKAIPLELMRLVPKSRGPFADICDILCHGDGVVHFIAQDKRPRGANKANWQQKVEEKWQEAIVAWEELGVTITLEFAKPRGTFKTYRVRFLSHRPRQT